MVEGIAFQRPDALRIKVFGRPPGDAAEHRRQLGRLDHHCVAAATAATTGAMHR